MSVKVGLVGCGNISEVYLRSTSVFRQFKIVACADLDVKTAARIAAQFKLRHMSVKELIEDPETEFILNLTPPLAHLDVNLQALSAGKHVYSEKPFAVSREDAMEIIKAADERGLKVGSAPDSFMGGTQQTCRKLFDSGVIGLPVGGTASIMHFCGHCSDHPNLGFFFRKGGGPLLDMGPYYLAALVNLLGPLKRVSGMGRRTFPERICEGGSNKGKTYPVEVNTHVVGLLEFETGALVTFNASFDVWRHTSPRIEIFGESGCLQMPEPSGFGGEVRIFTPETGEWKVADICFGYTKTTRGLGLADFVEQVGRGQEPRCSSGFAYHLIDAMCALEESSKTGCAVEVKSSCERPRPLTPGLLPGQIDPNKRDVVKPIETTG